MSFKTSSLEILDCQFSPLIMNFNILMAFFYYRLYEHWPVLLLEVLTFQAIYNLTVIRKGSLNFIAQSHLVKRLGVFTGWRNGSWVKRTCFSGRGPSVGTVVGRRMVFIDSYSEYLGPSWQNCLRCKHVTGGGLWGFQGLVLFLIFSLCVSLSAYLCLCFSLSLLCPLLL